MEKILFKTTICWRCPTVYPMTDHDCPHCHATNANVNQNKAIAEMAGCTDIRDWTIDALEPASDD